MTVATTTNKAIGTGNGLATTFPFTFGTLPTGDLVVTLISPDGIEEVQTEITDYTVLGEGSEDGGSVVFSVAPPDQYTVLIQRIVPILQPTDYKNQGSFYPRTHERSFDRSAMIDQQLFERVEAAMTLPPQITGVSTTLPAPESNTIFGWNAAGDAIQNFPLSDIATNIAYGDKTFEVFAGTGAQTVFPLIRNPGSLGNLDISIDGVTQVNGVDFTYAETNLTITPAPANGAVILVRYDVAVPVGTALATAVSYTPPQTGVPTSVSLFLDALWSTGVNAGATLIRWIQSGVGAVARTIEGKFRELPSVLDYIPVAEHAAIKARTSTYDCAAAFQACATAHAEFHVPAGTYPVTDDFTLPVGTVMRGDGWVTTKLARAGADQSYVVMSANCEIHDIGFQRGDATVVTSGKLITAASGCKISNVFADHCWNGIYATGVSGLFMSEIYITGWRNAAINVDGGCNDVFLDNFILSHTGINVGTGIRLHNQVEAFIATNGDVIGGNIPLSTSADAAFVPGNRVNPNFNKFANVYFDSSVSGVSLEKASLLTFDNCWFATATLGNGATVGHCYDVRFNGCDFVTNGGAGAQLTNASSRGISFTDCNVINNNLLNNGSNGITVAAGVSDFSIVNCTLNNSLFTPAPGQVYGIAIAAGASDRYTLRGNNVNGNLTGGISDGGTGSSKKVSGNLGHEPSFTAPAFLNSWVNFDAVTNQQAGYWKDEDGFVHLRGLIKSGVVGSAAFTLPAGFRPSLQEIFAVPSNVAFGEVYVQPSGDVIPFTGNNTYFSLAGIRFKAA